jgi:hypothetical protein
LSEEGEDHLLDSATGGARVLSSTVGAIDVSDCPLCGGVDDEDSDHIFCRLPETQPESISELFSGRPLELGHTVVVLEVMWMLWKSRSRKVFDDVTHRHGHPPHRPPTSLGVSGEMTNGHRPPQRMVPFLGLSMGCGMRLSFSCRSNLLMCFFE